MAVNTAQAVCAVVVFLCGFFPFCYFFYRFNHLRHTSKLIQSRAPLLVLAFSVAVVGFLTAWTIQCLWPSSFTCLGSAWNEMLFTVVCGHVYIIRAWLLFFRLEVAQEQITAANTHIAAGNVSRLSVACDAQRVRASTGSARLFVSEHMWIGRTWLVSSKLILPLSVCVGFFQLLPIIVTSFLSVDSHSTTADQCREDTRIAFGFTLFYNCTHVCVLGYIAYRLRGDIDHLMIKDELKWTSIAAAGTAIVVIAFNSHDSLVHFSRTTFSFPQLVFATFLVIIIYLSLIRPVRLVERDRLLWGAHPRIARRGLHEPLVRVVSNAYDPSLSLAELLKSPRFFAGFQHYLVGEFSVENLVFWNDVCAFVGAVTAVKTLPTKPSPSALQVADGNMSAPLLRSWCLDIYETYIRRDSPLEVNLPSWVIERIDEQLGTDAWRPPQPHSSVTFENVDMCSLFSEAQQNIFRLMETDSFPRWRGTDAFYSCIQQHRAHAVQHKVLHSMDLLS